MVNEQLCIYTELLVQEVLVLYGTPGHITHRQDIVLCKSACNTFSDTPEISERSMFSKFLSIGHFIKFGNADTVLIWWHLLGYNIHGYFTQIHIGADSGSCRNTRFRKDMIDYLYSQFMSRHLVRQDRW